MLIASGGVSLPGVMTDDKYTNNFVGCITDVKIHSNVGMTANEALSGYNVQPCSLYVPDN